MKNTKGFVVLFLSLTFIACTTVSKMSDSIEPIRLFDNLFFVGTTAVGPFIVDTGDGLVMIDTGNGEADAALMVHRKQILPHFVSGKLVSLILW